MKITKEEARKFLIEYHFLNRNNLSGTEGIKEIFDRLLTIQFDPLNQVGYNPHLVLQSRISNYKSEYLEYLLYKERYLIDHWDKNMSIIKTEDFPYMKRIRNVSHPWYRRVKKIVNPYIDVIKKNIEENAPISSANINIDGVKIQRWNNIKVSKIALETMFYKGEIGIHHKKNSIRYFDLIERLIPRKYIVEEDVFKKDIDYYKYMFLRRLKSVGLITSMATEVYVGIYYMKSLERKQAINELLQENKIIELEIEGIKGSYYIETAYEKFLSTKPTKKVSLIAPLDNLMWDRKMIKNIFDFDYVWEVYKPKKDRIYGYYVLPILYGDQFVGRLEPIYNKTKNRLEIHSIFYEKHFKPDDNFNRLFMKSIEQFKEYLGANEITLTEAAKKTLNALKIL